RAHDAAEAMFGRAARQATALGDYANALSSALSHGAETIGAARRALLAKADEVDAGPLHVTDEWVVVIDAVRMSPEELARLKELARAEQAEVNRLLAAVGDADDDTADAMVAAGEKYGFVKAGAPSDFGSMLVPVAQRPRDRVPDPRDPVGMAAQGRIRAAYESTTAVADTEATENEHGDVVSTKTMQDGSSYETIIWNPFDWPSKQNFASIVQYDVNGDEVSSTSSWHDYGTETDYTEIVLPDGSFFTATMDSNGNRRVGYISATGVPSELPVEVVDQMSNVAGAGLSGLEKHLGRGGSLPMVTAESVESVSKATKFAGPALTLATTAFDMAMADTAHDACVAAVAGAAGAGGGWAGAELGAAMTFLAP
ncbi:hypothetical protein AB0K45_12455, partial [Micrococcus luteus]|uniref:hypothetical protein n=1 Tax=Micrococcus luteus TaxID=1270 RepID=UPI003429ABBD